MPVAPAPEPGYTPFPYFPGNKLHPSVLGKVPGSLRAQLSTNEVPPVVEEFEEIPATRIDDQILVGNDVTLENTRG